MISHSEMRGGQPVTAPAGSHAQLNQEEIVARTRAANYDVSGLIRGISAAG